MKTSTPVLLLLLGLAGCSSAAKHQDVKEGVGGVNSVVIRTDDIEAGSHEAVTEANQFCSTHGQTAVFIKDSNPTTDKMNTKDYDSAERATNVAKTVGSDVNTSDVPAAASIGGIGGAGAGVPADQALSKSFKVEMRFKCQ